MADIQLREQFPPPPDLSVYSDAADYDVWLREQFPASPDLSVYRTILPLQQAPTGAPLFTFVLDATEAQDAAAFSFVAGRDFALTATEAPDAALIALTLGHPFVLDAIEAQDAAAFTVTVTSGGATRDFVLSATEAADLAAFSVTEIPSFSGGSGGGTLGGWRRKDWKWSVEWWKEPPEEVTAVIEKVVTAKPRASLPVLERRIEAKTPLWVPDYRQIVEIFRAAYLDELERQRAEERTRAEMIERAWLEVRVEELRARRRRTKLRIALLTLH